MNKLLIILSFLISLICLSSHSWALPPCPTSGTKHNCYGSNTWKDGSTYIGDFQNNKIHGKGIYTWVNPFEQYVGEWKYGKKHGQGTSTWADGEKYLGVWKDNNFHGQGTYTWKKSGNKYVGEWKNGKINGQGTKTFADGTIEEGIWKDNKFMYAKKLTPTSNSKIEGYKNFCSDIGFTPGTEKFGDCVVEAMKKG